MAAAAHQRQKLCETIERWNATMMDIFAISLPDENTEFHGVIRFHLHHQNHQRGNNNSLPLLRRRVPWQQNACACPAYTPGERHAHGGDNTGECLLLAVGSYDDDDNGTGGISERHMDADERPLLVQLGWCCHNNGIASGNKERSDGSERCVPPSPMHNGRFVLRRRLPSAGFTRSVPRRFSKWRSGQWKRESERYRERE
ncbi:hypothetical protein niasHS_011529 [Heterodera schachtii]|uniref:Uncharacterized protein n=1 Tax=Heterodera schachtii TaxID=97005 RepID=A0ABD2I9C6_HETSC